MKYERMGGMWRACVAWKWLVGGCSGMWTDIGMFPQRHFQNLSNSADKKQTSDLARSRLREHINLIMGGALQDIQNLSPGMHTLA